MNPKRTISNDEKAYLMSIKPDDISISLLEDLFEDEYDRTTNKIKPSKFNTYDEFTLNANEYFNKEKLLTNCGLFILNKAFFEKTLYKITGYINTPFDKSTIGKIDSMLASAVLEDRTDIDDYIEYMNKLCFISYGFNTQICTSLTYNSMVPFKEVESAKSEFIKKHKKELDNNDVFVASEMESELVKVAKKCMANDPAMELYESGARGGFDNAYKNAQIMKGPVYNASHGEFEVMTNALYHGIDKENVATLANSVINSNYSKAVATGDCGYDAKKLTAAYQSVSLDKRGSDCKSRRTLKIKLTPKNKNYFKYMYMKQGNDFIVMTDDVISKHLNKTIEVRVPLFCSNHSKICNKCAGDMYYMLGTTNIGLLTNKISNAILNRKMKAVHVANVKTTVINPDDVFE